MYFDLADQVFHLRRVVAQSINFHYFYGYLGFKFFIHREKNFPCSAGTNALVELINIPDVSLYHVGSDRAN